MTDRHRYSTSGRRSPTYNPARMSMPIMPTTTSGYSSFYGSDIHVIPTSRHETPTPTHYNHHRNNSSDWRGPNVPVTTTTYTVRKDPVTRASSVREDSRNRSSTTDAAVKRPPIIVTTRKEPPPPSHVSTPSTHVPPSPAPDRGRDNPRPNDEDQYYAQPASSIRSRSHARPYHASGSISSTLDNEEFLRLRQRTNDERLLPSRTEHRRERPTSMYADPSRISTKTLDLGDSGYEYTTPSALARYDLDNEKPPVRRSRRESVDRDAYYRPSVNVSTDVGRPYDGRPRAPPPSRALDTYNRRVTEDSASGVYDRPSVRVPAPTVIPLPVAERRPGQLDVPPSPMERIERRPSRAGPRPVSLYQDPPRPLHNDVYRARDDGYVPRDHRDREYLRDEDLANRGFAPRVDGERKDERVKGREREDVPLPRERRIEQRRDARPDDRERESRRRPDEELDRRDERRYSRDQGRKEEDPRLEKKSAKDDTIREDDRPKEKVRDKVATGLSLAAGAISLGEALTHKGKDEKADKDRSPRRHADEEVRESEAEERYKPPRKEADDVDDAEERERNRREAEARLTGEPAMSGALDGSSSSDESKPRRRRRASSAFRPNDTAGLMALKEQLKAKEESDKENGKARSKDTSPDRRSQSSPSNRDSLEDPAKSSKEDSRGRDSASAHDDKQVRVVSPPRDKDDRKPIKGILKQPKPAFPEEPNPVREGVAPHKDDKTKGNVPPGARWTKISRKLVNPEALTIGKERFEVREDFVIVLRVLNKEEIEAYTAATAQLRDMRRKEYEREQERDRDDDRDDDDSDERRPHRSHRRDPRDEDEDERRRREEKREREKEGRSSRRHRYEDEEPRRLEYYPEDARDRLPHRSHRHREREREAVPVSHE